MAPSLVSAQVWVLLAEREMTEESPDVCTGTLQPASQGTVTGKHQYDVGTDERAPEDRHSATIPSARAAGSRPIELRLGGARPPRFIGADEAERPA